MTAFPKIGYCFKLKPAVCTGAFVSHRMVVSRIIESGERLTKEQVSRFYNLYHDDVTEATFKRLTVFVRPRVLFWDFTNGHYRIYPWDEQTAKRIWERLVPIGMYDAANNTIEESHIRPILEKKLKALEKITTGTTELDLLFKDETEQKTVLTVSWSEHAKVVTELAALKATLKRHFPSLKFD